MKAEEMQEKDAKLMDNTNSVTEVVKQQVSLQNESVKMENDGAPILQVAKAAHSNKDLNQCKFSEKTFKVQYTDDNTKYSSQKQKLVTALARKPGQTPIALAPKVKKCKSNKKHARKHHSSRWIAT